MNHFMLPDDGRRDMIGSSARYGTYAMEILINHLLKMGARKNRLEAKVFGGGAVLASLTSSNIGAKNAEFVLNYLKTEKIPIVAKDLLDSYPRKVYYFPETGRVMLKKLHRVHNETLFNRERDYKDRLAGTKMEGEIELFI
jgi:chemotaxis protein CheD